MKKLALLATFGVATLTASAQFGTAPDFNVTDLDGNTHQLYADILDQGLIAVVDVSATWCSPCWSLHGSHALQDLHEAYGPDGTRIFHFFPNHTLDISDDLQSQWHPGIDACSDAFDKACSEHELVANHLCVCWCFLGGRDGKI